MKRWGKNEKKKLATDIAGLRVAPKKESCEGWSEWKGREKGGRGEGKQGKVPQKTKKKTKPHKKNQRAALNERLQCQKSRAKERKK